MLCTKNMLVFQMTHGASLAPDPEILHPPFAADIVRQLLLAAHILGILVNLLLRKFCIKKMAERHVKNMLNIYSVANYDFRLQYVAFIGAKEV